MLMTKYKFNKISLISLFTKGFCANMSNLDSITKSIVITENCAKVNKF